MEVLNKKDLRRISSLIGFSFLVSIVASFIFSIGYTDLVALTFVGNVSNVLAFLFLLKFYERKNKIIFYNEPFKKNHFVFIGAGLLFMLAAGQVSLFITNLCNQLGFTSLQPDFLTIFKGNIFLLVLFVVILAPLIEEFIFRGVILNILRPYGVNFAVIISALLFGLFHGNIEQFVGTSMLGLCWGFVVMKTKSIWTSIILHFINNAFAVLFMFLEADKSLTTLYYVIFYSLLVVGSVAFGIFIKSKSYVLQNKKALEPYKDLKGKVFNFIFTPGMILFFIYVMFMFYNSFKIL